MKTYIQFLDTLIVSFIVLAINFQFSNNVITDSYTTRSGIMRTMIISWQTLMMVAGFCAFLRYVARNVK